ncbi:hypothetical protein BH09BAC5_BH09BAC5_18610 [soil metagenome]
MRLLLPLFTLSLIFSCASSEPDKSKTDSAAKQVTVKPLLKKGDFTDLTVSTDPSNSFSVYLPADFDSAKKYPVVIFFDAHANGKLPLTNYKDIAEKWGYIFVGSNSSKNGLDMQTTKNIGEGLLNEIKNILPVDPNEILLCGFSGGARVAAFMAAGRPEVKGVICNSAAPQAPLPGKIYVGLAGLGDMNYLEMKTFSERQQTNNSPHDLLVFDGKHEWAPEAMMEDALLIATSYHGVKTMSPRDSTMSVALAKNLLQAAIEIKSTSSLIESTYLEIGIKYSRDYGNPTELVNTNDLLRKSPAYNKDVSNWMNAEKEESKLQQEIGNSLLSEDTTWWKQNSPRLFESGKDGADKFMHQRSRGYASLMCYSYANQAFKSGNLHAAEKLVTVYSIVDPTNSEWAYMKATLFVQLNLNEYAFAALNKAIELGFNDKNRLLNDPVFASLRGDEKFAAILGKLN